MPPCFSFFARAFPCPISEGSFLELMKQTDVKSRLSTASLVDQLSKGVPLKSKIFQELLALRCWHTQAKMISQQALTKSIIASTSLGDSP